MKKFILSALVIAAATFSAAAFCQSKGLSPITDIQSEKIDLALRVATENKQIAVAINEAKGSIAGFLRINSCLSGYDASRLNVFAAPGKIYPNNNYIGGPIPTLRHHPKGACATVLRVQGWSMPSNNSLQFEVVYVSDASGESAKFTHEVQRQPNGEWLFSK